MKKNRFLIIILTIVISFCFGIGRVEAEKTYPYCDINQYGSVSISNAGKSTQDADFVTTAYKTDPITNQQIATGTTTLHDSEMTVEMSLDEKALESQKNNNKGKWWFDGAATITYTIDAGPGGHLTEITYSLYHEPKNSSSKKVCESQLTIPKNSDEVVKVTFKINKGHLHKINMYAMYSAGVNNGYVAGGGSLGLEQSVKKGLSKEKNEKMPVNTSRKNDPPREHAAGPCVNPDGTGCNDAEKVVSSKKAEEEDKLLPGTKKASGTKTVSEGINGETSLACNTIGGVFDEYWPYVMIFVPILLIVMISIDFFKAMISGDADAIKKSSTNTIKRTIPAIILLALPALLRFIFEWFGIDFCI